MDTTQGLLATLVAETAPMALRDSAYWLFHLVSGIALLSASSMAGVLWDWYGPSATFVDGAGFTTISLIGFVTLG